MLEPILSLAVSPEAAEGANMLADIAGKFGVNWKLLIAQIINFAIVTYLLYRFAFKPVLKTLADRQKKIADGLQYAQEMEETLKDAEKQHAQKLKQAATEAKTMMDAAREQAKSYTVHQAQAAIAKTKEMIKKAEEAIALEKKQMLADVRKEVAHLVVVTSQKVLTKELSSEDRLRYSESAAKELRVA